MSKHDKNLNNVDLEQLKKLALEGLLSRIKSTQGEISQRRLGGSDVEMGVKMLRGAAHRLELLCDLWINENELQKENTNEK